MCHCGRELTFQDCCGAIHKGKQIAETAEDLMRSRYSAFVEADVDYILATYAKETCPLNEREEILEWAKSVEWIGLEIINTKAGQEDQSEGFVEFKAHFKENGNINVLHENSFFRKETEKWVYVSGEYPKQQKARKLPGRNEVCFCGSGKKFKKCCGK